jgi:hypothetical protein
MVPYGIADCPVDQISIPYAKFAIAVAVWRCGQSEGPFRERKREQNSRAGIRITHLISYSWYFCNYNLPSSELLEAKKMNAACLEETRNLMLSTR